MLAVTSPAMRKLLILFVLLASCSQRDEPKQDGRESASAAAQTKARPAQAPRIAGLVGLYEGGTGDRKNQMCVVEGKGGEARFGLVVWGANMHSCSGAGTLNREGGTLRLAMAGDSACTVEAVISGKTVRLPQETPQGCAYYCGARAKLGGAELTQVGTGEDDAMKAKDLVGDPLCATEGG